VLEKLFNYADLNPNDTKIKYISRTVAIIAAKDTPTKQKDILKKLMSRLTKISDDNYYQFSHFLQILTYYDLSVIKEAKDVDVGGLLTNFLKVMQLRHNIINVCNALRSIVEKSKQQEKVEFMRETIKKSDLKSLVSFYGTDEDVSKAIDDLYTML